MFQRYWRVAVIGLGLGFVLGAGLFAMLAMTGNPDWRAHLTGEEGLRSVTFYGLCGVVVAAASSLGAWASIALTDRALQKGPGARIRAAAVGAAAATIVLGLIVSVTISLADGSAGWMLFLVALSLLLAMLSAFAAAVLVSVREERFPLRRRDR